MVGDFASITNSAFDSQKKQCLSAADLSRKGSIDEPISHLVDFINGVPDLFTTSSCSGRVLIYSLASSDDKKRNCRWHLVSHDAVTWQEMKNAVVCCEMNDAIAANAESGQSSLKKDYCHDEINNGKPCHQLVHPISGEVLGTVNLKFEPVIFHVQCRSLAVGKRLHQLVQGYGFKNSGLTLANSGKITLAIRATLCLEAPVRTRDFVVPDAYFQCLEFSVRDKFTCNKTLIDKLYTVLTENYA